MLYQGKSSSGNSPSPLWGDPSIMTAKAIAAQAQSLIPASDASDAQLVVAIRRIQTRSNITAAYAQLVVEKLRERVHD